MSKNIIKLIEEAEKLKKENKALQEVLQQKLKEAKESLDAIRGGNIDALIISDKKDLKIYTEKNADKIYRILVEKMNEGAVTLNKDGTIIYCNTGFAKMLNLPLQKVIGAKFQNFIHDSLKKSFGELFKQGKENVTKVDDYLYGNNQVIPVLMSVNTFSLDNNFVSSIILTDLSVQNKNQEELRTANEELREKTQLLQRQEEKLIRVNDELLHLNQDLEKRVFQRTSELENLNDELKDLNISKDKFLSVINHDLRNPLAALLLSSEKLSRITENPAFDALVKTIHRITKEVLEQLNELVDWSKMQLDKIVFNLEEIHLVHIVDQSFGVLTLNASLKNIVLENKIPPDIYVNADRLMLRSIFQSLGSNAIKNTPEGGSVIVTARRINNFVEVCVKDSGLGREDEFRNNLFTYSKSEAGINYERGSVLSLILVKDFVTQHGGSIRVESEKGEGTSVIFTLPEH